MNCRYAFLLLALMACDTQGPKGDAGADGADGQDGANGLDGQDGADGQDGQDGNGFTPIFTGVVQAADGPTAGVPVVAMILDEDGAEFAPIGAALTDSAGNFAISVANITEPTTSVLLVASPPGGELWSLGVDTTLTIDPASTAVTQVIRWIVGSEGGRSVADFSIDEVNDLVSDADAALTAAGTDLSDADAVLTQVLADVGRDIAEASGGTYTYDVAVSPVTTDPTDVYTNGTGDSYLYLFDGLGEEWDIYAYYGYISDGSSDSYDGWGDLWVGGERWSDSSYIWGLEDDREWVGPVSVDLGEAGLEVQRKIFVPETKGLGYARFTELLTNTTADPITVDVEVEGNLGSDESNNVFTATSSGDQEFDEFDVWAVNNQDSSDPIVGWIFPGGRISKDGDDIYLNWDGVTIDPGETVTITHWSLQRSTGTAQDLIDYLSAEVIDGTGAPSSADWYEGLSTDEADLNTSPLIGENITGEAGTVTPYAELGAINTTTGGAVSGTAAQDGSFGLAIAGASGDTITLTSSDGLSDTFTLP